MQLVQRTVSHASSCDRRQMPPMLTTATARACFKCVWLYAMISSTGVCVAKHLCILADNI